jgi:hypothetical protein
MLINGKRQRMRSLNWVSYFLWRGFKFIITYGLLIDQGVVLGQPVNLSLFQPACGMLSRTQKIPYLPTALWILAIGYGLYTGFGHWRYVEQTMTYNEWADDEPVNDIAAFLEKHTEPGSIIGMTGGGNAGYFIKDRTVVNMDGLITASTSTGEKKAANIYEHGNELHPRQQASWFIYKGQIYTEWTDIKYG